MSGLIALPEETLVHILCRTPPLAIIRCREVCRFLWKIVDSSVELQYLIELYSASYIPPSNPRIDLSYTEKLVLLQRHQKQWETNLSPGTRKYPLLRTAAGQSSTYDFYGGVYARGSSLVPGGHTRRLDLYQLPSVNKGIEWKQWSHIDLGVDVRDFVMDPDYDLLALVEMNANVYKPGAPEGLPDSTQYFTIHIRSLETSQPHPDAAHATISYNCPSWRRASCSFYFQVVGRYLAVVFSIGVGLVLAPMFHLVIWDWTTGKMITYVKQIRGGPESFTFLSDQMFVLPSPKDHGQTRPTRDRGQLDIYTFTEPRGDSPPEPARCIASFLLPGLIEGGNIYKMACRSDPAPPPSSQTVTRHHGRPSAFQLAPDNRVLCLTIQALDPEEGELHLIRGGMLYIPFSILLGAARHLVDEHNPIGGHVEIPWQDWGEETSWMDMSMTFMGNECYVYGQRVVMIGMGDIDFSDTLLGTRRSLIVFDFDPIRTKRLSLQPIASFKVTDATNLGDILELPMEADLLRTAFLEGEHKANRKFAVRKTDVGEDATGSYYVMVDDEHVVLVLHNNRGQESFLLVYSFN